MIDSQQASAALDDVNDVVRRVRQSQIYQTAGLVVTMWGVLVFAAYVMTYTWPRQGTPVTEPEVYAKSAPIQHLDKLARPLLVLHGTNDVNVSFIDSLKLFDQLIKQGKPFESQIYPGEIHFFRRDFVLRDAWTRIEDFFERTVKK